MMERKHQTQKGSTALVPGLWRFVVYITLLGFVTLACCMPVGHDHTQLII
jgi:hypothetical protein